MKKFVVGKNINFKNCSEFLKWFMDEDGFNKNILFESDSKEVLKMEAMHSFLMNYYSVKKECSKCMDRYNDLFASEDNKFLKEAMEQFVLSNGNGKYLRAFLVSLGYHSFGKDDDYYVSLALALELFQTSILIHDDIIDNASVRRGVPTIPLRYEKIYEDTIKDENEFVSQRRNISNSMALCIGDLGLYLANQMIVKNYSKDSKLGDILEYYNDIAIKTCKGEMIDVILPFYERFYGDISDLEKQIIDIYKYKTGWYSVVGPFVLGAILGGASCSDIEKLEDALLGLGIAFQIKDDILGVFGNEKKLGKSITSDVSEFKQTILYSFTVNTSYKDRFLELYGKNLDGDSILELKNILKESGALEYATDYMNKIFQDSTNEILKLNCIDSNYKKLLLGFAEFLKVRDK